MAVLGAHTPAGVSSILTGPHVRNLRIHSM